MIDKNANHNYRITSKSNRFIKIQQTANLIASTTVVLFVLVYDRVNFQLLRYLDPYCGLRYFTFLNFFHNTLCQVVKRHLHFLVLLCAHLNKSNPFLFCKVLALRVCHLTLIFQVCLVSDQQHLHSCVSIRFHFLQPFLQMLKRLFPTIGSKATL